MDAKAPQIACQKPKRARITRQDVENIAKLTALRLSERQACLKLDVPYQQWLKWKSRQRWGVVYDTILTRMKADRLSANLAEIEKAATGDGVRHDWRAADRMLQIIQPDVYNPRQEIQQSVPPVAISIEKLQIINQMVQERLAKERRQTITIEPVKAIDNFAQGL